MKDQSCLLWMLLKCRKALHLWIISQEKLKRQLIKYLCLSNMISGTILKSQTFPYNQLYQGARYIFSSPSYKLKNILTNYRSQAIFFKVAGISRDKTIDDKQLHVHNHKKNSFLQIEILVEKFGHQVLDQNQLHNQDTTKDYLFKKK